MQTQRTRSRRDGVLDAALPACIAAGRRDVDRLFEEGPLQRIWLVEHREHPQMAVFEQPFDCVFLARDVALDEHGARIWITQRLHLARMQQGCDSSVRRVKFRTAVRANHAAASGEHERLNHARERHLAGIQRARIVDRIGREPRDREPGGAEPLA